MNLRLNSGNMSGESILSILKVGRKDRVDVGTSFYRMTTYSPDEVIRKYSGLCDRWSQRCKRYSFEKGRLSGTVSTNDKVYVWQA